VLTAGPQPGERHWKTGLIERESSRANGLSINQIVDVSRASPMARRMNVWLSGQTWQSQATAPQRGLGGGLPATYGFVRFFRFHEYLL
jgi:hypothetical protein